MRNTLFLDTEFNGHGGELISMALVSDDGREWYQVRHIPDDVHPWVGEHVVPLLGKEPLGDEVFRFSLHTFLLEFVSPVIMCDWHADAAHFAESLAGPDYRTSLNYDCTIRVFGQMVTQPQPEVPHNALSDARALRDWWLALPAFSTRFVYGCLP